MLFIASSCLRFLATPCIWKQKQAWGIFKIHLLGVLAKPSIWVSAPAGPLGFLGALLFLLVSPQVSVCSSFTMLYNIKKTNEPYQVYIQKMVDGIAKTTTLKKRWLSTPFFLQRTKCCPFLIFFFVWGLQNRMRVPYF